MECFGRSESSSQVNLIFHYQISSVLPSLTLRSFIKQYIQPTVIHPIFLQYWRLTLQINGTRKLFSFFFCREKADTDANEMSICHSFFNAMKLIILTKHWSTPTTYNLGRNGVQFATLKQHINKLLAISQPWFGKEPLQCTRANQTYRSTPILEMKHTPITELFQMLV